MNYLLPLILLLASFNAYATGIHIGWIAPTEREDATAISLSELGGFKIYYGTAPDMYNDSISINDNTATTYALLVPNGFTYHIVVTAIDTEGRESLYSPAIAVDLPLAAPKSPTGVTAVAF